MAAASCSALLAATCSVMPTPTVVWRSAAMISPVSCSTAFTHHKSYTPAPHPVHTVAPCSCDSSDIRYCAEPRCLLSTSSSPKRPAVPERYRYRSCPNCPRCPLYVCRESSSAPRLPRRVSPLPSPVPPWLALAAANPTGQSAKSCQPTARASPSGRPVRLGPALSSRSIRRSATPTPRGPVQC